MRIDNITINGVAGITELAIPFDTHMNIICGPNGIGKTTVLESVAHCFSTGETAILKRHVKAEKGRITAVGEHQGQPVEVEIDIEPFEPTVRAKVQGRHDLSANVLSLKTTRTFVYTPLQAVSRDTEKTPNILWEEAKQGVALADLKNWFVNRYLYSAHPGTLTPEQLANFELAKACFSELDADFAFARVNAASNEIMVSTPSGEIYYEYLSAGFKSCLALLFGIIKEVEFRFPTVPTRADRFDGLVLIDELELHLHPEWQYRIAHVLSRIFPAVQFITTTHSPHVIQSAERNQIVALESRGGEVFLRDLPKSEHGFKGWTLDEVLTDVMGMEDTRTEEFRALMNRFAAAIDMEDGPTAEEAFSHIDASLHPNSHIRKLLRLQLASVLGSDDDQA